MKTDTRIIAENIKSECGFEFLYRLSVSETVYDEGKYPSYSVYASIKNDSDGYYDEVTVCNLTSIENVALDFFRLISEGTATPMTLIDIAEDYIP